MKYEDFVKTTDVSNHDLQFYLDGMSEEHGELFGVIKRIRRGDYGEEAKKFMEYHGSLRDVCLLNEDIFEDLVKELGDHHWYETRLLQELGITWHDVEEKNQNKLAQRVQTNSILGKGDNRENDIK